MTKLGVITIGQAPRVDMVPEMALHWPGIEVLERGALDGFTAQQVASVPVRDGDEILTSRLRDGTSAVFGRDLVLPRLQDSITSLEAAGVDAVLLVCTGVFPDFTHDRPLHLASPLLVGGVAALAQGPIGVICPLEEQRPDALAKFAPLEVLTAVANPYRGGPEQFTDAARALVEAGATLLVLDCMGYSEAHRDLIRAAAPGVGVVVARSLVARLVAEVVAA